VELAALQAQAVISGPSPSNPWALENPRLRSRQPSPIDYAGIGFRTRCHTGRGETRGEVLLWQGQPIDGFFHSTCGGRTADGPGLCRGQPPLPSFDPR
jgi:hypothetical protein